MVNPSLAGSSLLLLIAAPSPAPVSWESAVAGLQQQRITIQFAQTLDETLLVDDMAAHPLTVASISDEELDANPALAEAIKPWHGRLAFVLAALVLLHVAAALKHHFVDHDGLLRRMRPGRQ